MGFLFSSPWSSALDSTQPYIQWVPGALSSGVKRPGCEAGTLPPSSAESKDVWSYNSVLQIRLHFVVVLD
jgi:hypothetical protein